jgi:hypothetical protein
MFVEPSKDVPLIVRAVVSVAALPVVFWLSVGTSADTIDRNEGVPELPLGELRKRFCDWLANTAVSVPEVVTGEPETVKIFGSDKPTDVTVPEPPPPVCQDVFAPSD